MRTLLVGGLLAVVSRGPALAEPAPPNAAYFADCFAGSAAARTFDRDGRYLRFACHGETARVFFEALGRGPPGAAYEERHDGALFRFTEKPVKNTIGLDYCRRSPAGEGAEEYACVLIYPAGAFLDR
ncbi:MAG: hypothetical protein H0X27_04060 [Caulobacteraceae bacterium]|nr:hypothetical protein [Caulobacteraceae bacterium]